MKSPLLSLITGTRNRPHDFRRLVDSIERHTSSVSWELIVSDASDIPIEHETVATAQTWPRIHVIPERPRKGCTVGYNIAFRQAAGKWVIWLNDDCIVEHEYADEAIGFMESHPQIGLGAIPYAEPIRPQYIVNSYFEMIYANFGIIRRDFGNEIGWFDEEFPMYANDNSLAFKVLMAGKGIAEIPGARIYHFVSHDQHRAENDDPERRRRDGELLIHKYGPHMPQMRRTYEQCGGIVRHHHDQTPRWMSSQVSG